MKFVLASQNAKKLTELNEILSQLGYEVISMAEAGESFPIEETGATFEENAMIKAEAVLAATGLASIADDSGLEVDALGGEPGIYSARYGGEGNYDDKGRNRLLLKNMEAVPDGQRTARFVSAVVCLIPGEEPIVVRGTVEGEILRGERGEHGFGYDPLFYLPSYEKTMAQLSPDEKNAISHRGNALRQLQERLRQRDERKRREHNDQ